MPSEEDIIRRMLNTPPKPRSATSQNKGCLNSDDYFLVVGRSMHVARKISKNEDGSIVVDLYRNLNDYKSDKAMERNFTYNLA